MAGNRSDSEILIDLIDEVLEYNRLRDEEWEFHDLHGCTGDNWDDNDFKEHEDILAAISTKRNRIRTLLVEATGDKNIKF